MLKGAVDFDESRFDNVLTFHGYLDILVGSGEMLPFYL